MPRPPPPPEPSVISHGMEYRALFGQVVSTPTPWLCPFLESGLKVAPKDTSATLLDPAR